MGKILVFSLLSNELSVFCFAYVTEQMLRKEIMLPGVAGAARSGLLYSALPRKLHMRKQRACCGNRSHL